MSRRATVVLLLLSGCAHTPAMVSDLPFGDPARRDREATLTLDAVTATATGETLRPEALPARLAGAQLVFVGEEHTNLAVHEAQRRLIADLLAAGRHVLV